MAFFYLDRWFAPLIGSCKQPVKYADLSILVISEDISSFLTYALFEIIHLHCSCLPLQY